VQRTLHVVALPHTTLTEKDASCAYSMKVLKFVPMMREQGCRVILYGPDEIECSPDEHVVITTEADRQRWGYGGPGGYDTTKPFLWDAGQPYWFEANTRAIDALRERITYYEGNARNQFLCLITGTQWPIANEVATTSYNNPITVEWGVGYEGVFVPFCAYRATPDAPCTDCARRSADRLRSGDPQLSMPPSSTCPSRAATTCSSSASGATQADVALDLTQDGHPAVIAGHGAYQSRRGRVTDAQDGRYMLRDVTCGCRGLPSEPSSWATRAIIADRASSPSGCVEAMLAAGPVLTSDWGSFTEIVTPDVGRRFRTIAQGAAALKEVEPLDRGKIRKRAMARYAQQAVGPMFTRWFDQLDTLWGKGMYE
jgi:hypothetical protein